MFWQRKSKSMAVKLPDFINHKLMYHSFLVYLQRWPTANHSADIAQTVAKLVCAEASPHHVIHLYLQSSKNMLLVHAEGCGRPLRDQTREASFVYRLRLKNVTSKQNGRQKCKLFLNTAPCVEAVNVWLCL